MGRFVPRRDGRMVALAAGIWAVLFHCFPLTLVAQEMPGDFGKDGGSVLGKSMAPVHGHMATEARYDGPQQFDILHYVLNLSFAMTTEDMGGTVEIRMLLKAPTDSLVLNEVALALDTVQVDGVEKAFTIDPGHETFTIRLGAMRNAGDTLNVAIAYRRVPGVARPSSRRGYYYFTPDQVSGELPDTLGYTMSEPSDARFWMPCFDDPSEKGTAEINATVPSGYVAASNGKLLGVTANSTGTVTWRWREDHEITPYLMCVTVSQWAVPTYPFVRALNDTVPVQYYVFQSDSAQAAAYLPTVAQMIGAFGQVYGDYPFDKYGMSGVTPFGYGGMEHQSMTTLHRSIETNETVVAHELAHQWWGDLVTCGTWPNIWLNESFATYSEAIWREHLGGFSALKSYMGGLERFYSGSWSGAVYDPEGQGFNLFDAVVYSKGAWVLHTLRGVVGDSVFFRTLRAYRQKFAGGNAVTDDLRAVADSVSGMSLGWFFDQWIYKPGWPVYAFNYTSGTDTITLRIYQQQPSPRPVYTMPIQIRFYHGGADTTIVVQNSAVKQVYRIPLAFNPDSVHFDPDNWILKQVAAAPTGVDEASLPLEFGLDQNYPNPFNPRTVVSSQLPVASHVRLAVYDLLGREVAVLVDQHRAAGSYRDNFDGRALASGVYVYRLTAGSFVASRRMVLIK